MWCKQIHQHVNVWYKQTCTTTWTYIKPTHSHAPPLIATVLYVLCTLGKVYNSSVQRLVVTGLNQFYNSFKMFSIVFEGPVGWTKKTTATQPNPTKCNQTISCGCPLLRLFGLPVALLLKIFENCYKTSCNLLQPVLYSIYNILHM